jgi:ERCC4-type nuclease
VFTITNGAICYDGRELGPTSSLLVDRNEPEFTACGPSGLGRFDSVVHIPMPRRVDYIFTAGDKVVGVESKKPEDFTASSDERRLARQMRTLLQEVDVACLMLRPLTAPPRLDLWQALVKLQCLGVVILPGPQDSLNIGRVLASYRPSLADGRVVLSVLAGTDRHRERPTRTPGWFLRNIRGIGPALAQNLHTRHGSTRAVFTSSREQLRLDVSPIVADRIEDALS